MPQYGQTAGNYELTTWGGSGFLSASGSTMARTDVPTTSSNWDALVTLMNNFTSAGYELMPVMTRAGTFSTFAATAAAAAKKYGPGGTFRVNGAALKKPMRYILVTNEPYYNGESADSHAQLCKLVYQAVKDPINGNPNCLVVLQGFSRNDGRSQDWLNGLYTGVTDIHNWCDAVECHPYGGPLAPDIDASQSYGPYGLGEMKIMRQMYISRNAAWANKQWVCGEWGVPATNGFPAIPEGEGWKCCITEAQAATYMDQARSRLEPGKQYSDMTWVNQFIYYHFRDPGTTNTRFDNYGQIVNDGSRAKPVHAKYNAAIAGGVDPGGGGGGGTLPPTQPAAPTLPTTHWTEVTNGSNRDVTLTANVDGITDRAGIMYDIGGVTGPPITDPVPVSGQVKWVWQNLATGTVISNVRIQAKNDDPTAGTSYSDLTTVDSFTVGTTTPGSTPSAPGTPGTPTVVGQPAATSVSIDWADVATATIYDVLRGAPATGGTGVQFASIPLLLNQYDTTTGATYVGTVIGSPTTSQFTDTTAQPGQTYEYRVVARNAGGSSAQSAGVIVTTPTVTQGPVALRRGSTANILASPGGTSLVLTQHASTVAGDLLIAAVTNNEIGASTMTAPSGWQFLHEIQWRSDIQLWTRYYYRTAQAGGAATHTWTFSVQQRHWGVLISYAGTGQQLAIASASATGTALTAPSVVSPDVGDLLVIGGSAGGITATTPAGMTQLHQLTTGTAGTDRTLFAWVERRSATGATGTRTSTGSPSDLWMLASLAVAGPATATAPPPATVSPQQRGVATVSQLQAAATSLTLTQPAATVVGDLLVASVHAANTLQPHSILPPAGWTQRAMAIPANGSSRLYVYTRAAADAGSATHTWTFAGTGASERHGGVMVAWQGSSYDVLTAVSGGATTSMAAAAVSPATANSSLLVFGAHEQGVTVTEDALLTQIVEQTSGGTTSTDRTVWLASQTVSAAGSTGSRTNTASTAGLWEQVTVSIAGMQTTTPPPVTGTGLIIGQTQRDGSAWMVSHNAAIGPTINRFEWAVETDFSTGLHDAFVRDHANAGMRVLPLCGYDGTPSRATQANVTRFFTTMAARYGPGGSFWTANPSVPYLPVTHIEFGNEDFYSHRTLTNTKTWAETYATLLRTATIAMRAVNPQVGVLAQADDGLQNAQGMTAEKITGFNVTAYTNDQPFSSQNFRTNIDEGIRMNGSDFWIVPMATMSSDTGTTVTRAGDTSDASIRNGIRYIHSQGARSGLKPHVDPPSFRGNMTLSSGTRAAWFTSYRNYILPLATIAGEEGCSWFFILAEMNGVLLDSANQTEILNTISAVRTAAGPNVKVAVVANQLDGLQGVSSTIWAQCDALCTDWYQWLGPAFEATPSVSTLMTRWTTTGTGNYNYVAQMAAVSAANSNKKVLTCEVGYIDVVDSHAEPYSFAYLTHTHDDAAQQRAYEAWIRVLKDQAWYGGGSVWQLPSDSSTNHAQIKNDTIRDWTPLNRPAEATVQEWWRPTGYPVSSYVAKHADIMDYIDGWTTHPYGDLARAQSKIDRARTSVIANGGHLRNQVIWATEFGMATIEDPTGTRTTLIGTNYGLALNLTYAEAATQLQAWYDDWTARYAGQVQVPLRYAIYYQNIDQGTRNEPTRATELHFGVSWHLGYGTTLFPKGALYTKLKDLVALNGGTPVPPPDAPVLAVDKTSITFPAVVAGDPSPASQQFRVSNTGTGNMAVTATDDASWLTVAPASASVGPSSFADFSVTPSVSGLSAGSYTATITVSSSTANVQGSPKIITATLVVNSAPVPTQRPVVTMGTPTVVGDIATVPFALSGDPPTSLSATRTTPSGVSTTQSLPLSQRSVTYSGLTEQGTYLVTINAANAGGSATPASATFSYVVVSAPPPPPPPPPTPVDMVGQTLPSVDLRERLDLGYLDSFGQFVVTCGLESKTLGVRKLRGTFRVQAGERQRQQAASEFGSEGALQVAESQDNGTVGATLIVTAATGQGALEKVAVLLAQATSPARDLYVRWRPDGARTQTVFPVRGTAQTSLAYEYAQFSQGKINVEVSWAVAPRAEELPCDVADDWSSRSVPTGRANEILNPSFESGALTEWELPIGNNNPATTRVVSEAAAAGSYSLVLTRDAGEGNGTVYADYVTRMPETWKRGDSVYAQCKFRPATTTSQPVALSILWRAEDNSIITSTTVTATVGAGGWTVLSTAVVTIPSDARIVRWGIRAEYTGTQTAGTKVGYVDEAMLEYKPATDGALVVGSYIDGDRHNAQWEGARSASRSLELDASILDEYGWPAAPGFVLNGASAATGVSGGLRLLYTADAHPRLWHGRRQVEDAEIVVLGEATKGGSSEQAVSPGLKYTPADGRYVFAAIVGSRFGIFLWDGSTVRETAGVALNLTMPLATTYSVMLRSEGDLFTAGLYTSEYASDATPARTVAWTDVSFGMGAGRSGYPVIAGALATGGEARIREWKVRPYTYRNVTLPREVVLPDVPGTANAAAEVHLGPRVTAGVGQPAWGMVAITPRRTPRSQVAGVATGLIVQAEDFKASAGSPVVTGSGTGFYNGSSRNAVEFSGTNANASGSIGVDIDPSILTPDQFSRDTLVEVFLRYRVTTGWVLPRILLEQYPSTMAASMPQRTIEYADVGKFLPSVTGTVSRVVSLGSLRLNPSTPDPARLQLTLFWSLGTSTAARLAFDEAYVVPVTRSATQPTGKALDVTYPKLIPDAGYTLRIGRDLSGARELNARPGNWQPQPLGMGGAPIQPTPGANKMLVRLSELVPDDPTVNSATESREIPADVHVAVTPRHTLVAK